MCAFFRKEVLSPFEDVSYTLHDPIYYGKIKRKNYSMHPLDFDIDAPNEAVEQPISPIKEIYDPKNFDFSFDPVRDARLVAKNAIKIFGPNTSLFKYWFQRYRLFSKLNDGILMDEEGWFSVTPELIATHIADRMVTHKDCVILDAFTGVGGNAIQFALKGALVYAIDLDPIKLRCARQNAKVYGVENRITFICGNFYHIAKSFCQSRPDGKPLLIDSIFLSPPWGGPEYLNKPIFELGSCVPDGFDIFDVAVKISQNIAYFLPRNTSSNQLMQIAGKTASKKVEIEHNVLNNKIKALTAYYGNLVSSS
jgi:trimethylguanosine synthase